MRFDNHLGLKHADAESLLLCRLKWTEQRSPQECRANPAAIISHGKKRPTVALLVSALTSPPGSRCFAGVEKQSW